MFPNLLVTMVLLKNGTNLRENTTYLFSVVTIDILYSRKMKIYYERKL